MIDTALDWLVNHEAVALVILCVFLVVAIVGISYWMSRQAIKDDYTDHRFIG